MSMISVIGVGGAGNNISNEASKFFSTGAINYSRKDLDSATNVKLKLQLPSSEGVGHNREMATELFQGHWRIAVDFVKENFSHSKVIIFPFATSGGSGAGITPMLLDILGHEMPNTIFVAMPILPDFSEVTVNQLNAQNTFFELSKLDILVLPVDNQQVKETYKTIGKNRLYQIANTEAVSLVHELYQYTEKHSKNGNFDMKDLLTTWSTKGIGVISKLDISQYQAEESILTPNILADLVQKSWQKNPVFVPIEKTQKHVMRAGIIFDAEEKYMEFMNYEKFFGVFKNGMPIDLFEGNYHEKSQIMTILTGLPWINERLEKIDEIINNNSENIQDTVSQNLIYQPKSSNLVSQIRSNKKAPSQSSRSVLEILEKYK